MRLKVTRYIHIYLQEYPKLRELIRLKNDVVAKTAHPPMYLKYGETPQAMHFEMNTVTN